MEKINKTISEPVAKFCLNLVYSRILLYGNGTERCFDVEFFSAKVRFTRVKILVERGGEIRLVKFSYDVLYHSCQPSSH